MSSVEGLRADIVWEANTGQAIADLGAVGEEYARTTGAMSDQALRLAAAQDRLTASIARSGPESRSAKTATIAYRQELAALTAEADAASAAVTKQAEAQARAASAATSAQLSNQLAAARSAGKALTSYVTTPTVILGAVALKMGLNFEDSMRLIQTQAGATGGEVTRLSAGVLDLVKSGQSFGQTANDMAKGLFPIESEGIRGAKALEILRVAAAGAAVGQTDLAGTSGALTSVMRIYGLDANQAAGAMATLSAAVGAGKLHMDDLNSALATKFLPTAKQLGITLPQALAALDVFTRAGIPAETAANNLTTAFIKMLTPTKAAASSLDELGLSSATLGDDLQRGGLPAALADLVKGYDALEQKSGKVAANQAIFQSFGGSRSGAPILALVQQYQSYLQGLHQVQQQANPGTFWTQVARTMDLPSQKMHADLAKITADMVKVGIVIAPIAADVAGGVAKIASAFGHLPGPAKTELGAIILLLAVGGPLARAVVGTIGLIDKIGPAFRTIPAKAAPAIAETEGELATLRAAGTRTAASLDASGAAGGAGLAAGVGRGAARAEGEVAGLRGSLLGLAGKAFAVSLILNIVPHSSLGQSELDKLHLGFLGHIPVIGGAETEAAKLGYEFGGGHRNDQLAAAAKRRAAGNRYRLTHPGFPDFALWKIGNPHGTRAEYEAEKRLDEDLRNPNSKQARADARRATNRGGAGAGGGGGGGGGGGSGLDQATRLQLQIQAAQLAVARGDKKGHEELVKALTEEIAYDRRQEAKEEDLIRRHVGNTQLHAQRLQALQADETAALGQLKSGQTKTASAARGKHTAADEKQQGKLESQVSAAQQAEQSARTVKAEQAAYDRERKARQLLLALYEREAHDPVLTASQRATAEKNAAAQRKQLAAISDKSREDQLKLAVLEAQNAVAKATVGSAAYDRAQKAEDKALAAEIAFYARRAKRRDESLAARKKDIAAELAARKQKAALDKKTGTSSAAERQERQAFLSEFAHIIGAFGPNAVPVDKHSGRAATHLYEAVHELRQQTHVLRRIDKSGRFPASDDALAAGLAVTG